VIDKAVARRGSGRVKDREAAAPAAMGVTIFRGRRDVSEEKS
jgi:hypothetical protein